MKYYQGYYKPINPEKYLGDVNNIFYRSRLELNFFRYIDRHPDVLKWASEEFHIPYVSPKDGRWHRYFPDVFISMRDKNGVVQQYVIEIKPDAQTKPPKMGKTKKAKKRFMYESVTYAVNDAKWKYAEEFCRKRGLVFKKMTEKDIPY